MCLTQRCCRRLLHEIGNAVWEQAVTDWRTMRGGTASDEECRSGVIGNLLSADADEIARSIGGHETMRARSFILLYVLAYRELELAIENAQPDRLVRGLRWSLVLTEMLGHTRYNFAVVSTLITLFTKMPAQTAHDVVASNFIRVPSGAIIATDLYVERTVCIAKQLMGQPSGCVDSEHILGLAPAAAILAEIRDGYERVIEGQQRRHGVNRDAPKLRERAATAARRLLRHSKLLCVLSAGPDACRRREPRPLLAEALKMASANTRDLAPEVLLGGMQAAMRACGRRVNGHLRTLRALARDEPFRARVAAADASKTPSAAGAIDGADADDDEDDGDWTPSAANCRHARQGRQR